MTNQQLADVLLHHWQNLWPLPPAERIKRIDEIKQDYEYEQVLDDVAAAVQEPEVMINRDPDGFATLHHGRRPILERLAWVLVLTLTVVCVWQLP